MVTWILQRRNNNNDFANCGHLCAIFREFNFRGQLRLSFADRITILIVDIHFSFIIYIWTIETHRGILHLHTYAMGRCSDNKAVVAAVLITLLSLWLLTFTYTTPFWYQNRYASSTGDNVTTIGLWGQCWSFTGKPIYNGTMDTGITCTWGIQFGNHGNATDESPMMQFATPDRVIAMSVVILILVIVAYLVTVVVGLVYVCCRPHAPSHLLAAGILLILGGCACVMVVCRLYGLGRGYVGLGVGVGGGVGGVLAGLVYVWKLWKVFTVKRVNPKQPFSYSEL